MEEEWSQLELQWQLLEVFYCPIIGPVFASLEGMWK